ncbi:hypothetical protein FKW77_008074 [Venturia effusa]|uniref:Uncharacterized protein n=1 Tax=Venturia effusa TaxID=50376 RepID=A0A517LKL8_9PEZI|nr:hypothetical protein FKW77_008074 [Venturia effusa]
MPPDLLTAARAGGGGPDGRPWDILGDPARGAGDMRPGGVWPRTGGGGVACRKPARGGPDCGDWPRSGRPVLVTSGGGVWPRSGRPVLGRLGGVACRKPGPGGPYCGDGIRPGKPDRIAPGGGGGVDWRPRCGPPGGAVRGGKLGEPGLGEPSLEGIWSGGVGVFGLSSWLMPMREAGRMSRLRGLGLEKANVIMRRHNNSVYDDTAIGNLARQIDALYWQTTDPEDPLYDQDADDVLRQGDDLTRDENIEKLSSIAQKEEQASAELRSQIRDLQELQSRRTDLQKKLASYRHLQSMLAPFKSPQNSIQPNLVTRDSPLADEMTKSKALGIRVAGRLAGMEESDGGGDEDDFVVDENEKLAAVLGTNRN